MKTKFGFFQWDSDRRWPDFILDDGGIIPQVNISIKPDVPREEHLAITLDSGVLVEYRRDQSVAAAPASTHSRVAVALVKARFRDDDQVYIDNRAKALQDHYNRAMQGHRTMEAVGFLVPYDSSTMRFHLDSRGMFDAVREVAGEEFTHIHVLGGGSEGKCGIARMSGTRAITYTPWNCFEPTDWHENGHNNGLHHSAKDGIEYGERDRVMGSGRKRRWFSAPHLYHAGALDENHVVEVLSGEDAHVHLVGFNTLELAVPSNADRMILLRQPGEHRMVAVSLDEDHIDVHVPFSNFSRSWSKTDLVAVLRRGETATVAGRTIVFENYRAGVASVTIDGPDVRHAWPSYPEVGSSRFNDCFGLWGNPQWGGQGLHILPAETDDTVRVVWLTWDYDYNPIWFSGKLQVRNGVARGILDLGGEESPEVSVMLTGFEEGLFRARLGHELFAAPLKRITRPESPFASIFKDLGHGKFETIEKASNGTEFGYLLEEGINSTAGVRMRNPDWELVQNGTVYKVAGGVRGAKADITVTPM